MLRPILLLLPAAFLLWPPAVSAQTPPSAPVSTARINAADLKWHRIVLHHITPGEVMERMNWKMTLSDPFAKNQEPPPTPAEANLPEGVMRMFSLTSNNILLLEATETGYKTCREIAAALDVAPRQVKTEVFLVAAPLSSKQEINLSHPNQAVLQLRKTDALFFQPSPASNSNYTTNIFDDDATAVIPFVLPFHANPFFLDNSPRNGSYLVAISSLRVIPHINSNGSITFSLDFTRLTPTPDTAASNQPTTITHTVSSGSMAAYDVTECFPPNSYRKLLFVTLTDLGPAAGSARAAATP